MAPLREVGETAEGYRVDVDLASDLLCVRHPRVRVDRTHDNGNTSSEAVFILGYA
jgi:hypothetical protein